MTRKEFIDKYSIKSVVNNMGETRRTSENSIILKNGLVASIVENNGVDVYRPNGDYKNVFDLHKKYSIAACDVDGYFDWNILNDHGGINGCIYCDTEDEILLALHIMRLL